MGRIHPIYFFYIVPLLGTLLTHFIRDDLRDTFHANGMRGKFVDLCPNLSSVSGICDSYFLIVNMSRMSWWLLIFMAAVTFAIWLVLSKGRMNQRLIGNLIRPLVVLYFISLVVNLVWQGVLLMYGWYVFETHYLNNLNYIVLAMIFGSLCIGIYSVVVAAVKMFKSAETRIMGVVVQREHDKPLFDFVEEVAREVGAKPPDHIVIGNTEEFYVTANTIEVYPGDTRLKGEILHLSAPLLRVFTKNDVRAVIAHELGHFKGDDTVYSKRFTPMMTGLRHAFESLSDRRADGSWKSKSLIMSPAWTLLRTLTLGIYGSLGELRRFRETCADEVAWSVAGKMEFATALVKCHLYSGALDRARSAVIRRVRADRPLINMPLIYASVVRYDINQASISEHLTTLGTATYTHPTDSHPPIGERISAAGIAPSDVPVELLMPPNLADSASAIVPNIRTIEEILTRIDNNFVKSRIAEQDDSESSDLLLAALAAHLVMADGSVQDQEVSGVENLASRMTRRFDPVDFREYFLYPNTLPTVEEVIDYAKQLAPGSRTALIDFAEAIAAMDGDVADVERALIDRLREELIDSSRDMN